MEQQHSDSSRNPCETLSFNVALHCTKTHQTEHREITFKCPPLTTLDVKKQIEKQYNVPVCIQILSYEGHPLENDTKLSALRVRHGDTFHVRYLAKGHCSEINNAITWMNSLSAALKRENPSVYESTSRELYEMIFKGLQEDELLRDLAFKYFSPWLDPVTCVNKLHFVYNGGVKVIMEVYSALLRRPWHDCPLALRYTEFWILEVLWNLVEDLSVRRLVTRSRGLQMCMQSLLRVRLEEGKDTADYEPSRVPRSFWEETIRVSVGTLCNFVELPECRVEVASNEDVLHQLTCITLAPSLHTHCAEMVAALFLTLAHTSQTHDYIANGTYIRRLFGAYHQSPGFDSDLEEGTLLLKYFTLLFLAQVALVSPQCITVDYYQIISNEMDLLFQHITYKKMMDCEIKNHYIWATIMPCVKLAYIPNSPQEESPIAKLQLLSLQLILFALQNMLGREVHRNTLLKEGLLDYVMCMPQYVPSSLKPQAKELAQTVSSFPDIPEGPSSLLNMVKARLAKMYLGLEQVLSFSVGDCLQHFSSV